MWQIEKDIEANKRQRLELLTKTQNNTELQQYILERCSRGEQGFQLWVNYFAWLHEPRVESQKIPFVTWEYQDEVMCEMIKQIEAGQDYFVDKSRDMGLSWMAITVATWGFLFKSWSGLIGSRKQEEVDTLGDLSTLFPKIRFILYNLPVWMIPPHLMDSWMRITDPDKQVSITGESTNENFGTGGRYKWILFDEFSKWAETAWAAWTSSAQATPCRIVISTPLGSGTKQAELRETNITQRHLHWSSHPSKSKGLYNITEPERLEKGLIGSLRRSPWYDEQCERMTDEEVAQELDINYERSAGGRVYGTQWDELVASGRLRRLSYDPNLPTFSFWDFGIGDPTSVGVCQVAPLGEAVYVIDHFEASNENIQIFYDWLVNHEYEGKPIPFADHYGDISGNHRELTTGRSVFEWLNDKGVMIQARKTNEIDEKHAVQMVLPKTYVDERLTTFIKSLNNFHYEWDQIRGEYKEKPHHDKFSHAPKAFAYFAVNHFTPSEPKSSLEKRIRELKRKSEQKNREYTLNN